MTTTDAPAADARLLITVDEAMRLLSVKRDLLYTLINSGAIKSMTIGRARRVVTASLYEYIERHQS